MAMTVRERVTRTIKSAIARLLYSSGALWLWQAVVLRRRLVVLMYHRVLTAREAARTGSHPGLIVDEATFASNVAVLKRRFNVLTLDDVARHVSQRIPFPDSSCLITFDDGWKDNFTNALPILEAHDLPATIFLPVNYVGTRRLFWRETLNHLLVKAVVEGRRDPARLEALKALLSPAGLDPVLAFEGGDPRAAIIRFVGVQPQLTAPLMQQLLPALAAALGVAPTGLCDEDAFIDWNNVATMRRKGISFGGHGAEHLRLSTLPEADAGADIRQSKAILDDQVPGATRAFSYPNDRLRIRHL
jgi:peptidoglycan/xylan/chitin deacetylase (PgdA/CDA1 family)